MKSSEFEKSRKGETMVSGTYRDDNITLEGTALKMMKNVKYL